LHRKNHIIPTVTVEALFKHLSPNSSTVRKKAKERIERKEVYEA
jgi:hypothetical protein